MAKFEETIRGIFHFYHYSAKRRRELKTICAILDGELGYFSNVKMEQYDYENRMFGDIKLSTTRFSPFAYQKSNSDMLSLISHIVTYIQVIHLNHYKYSISISGHSPVMS